MELIDDYCFKILKKLEGSNGITFTDLGNAVRNKKTRINRLKWLLKENVIFQQNGLYKLSEKGKEILSLLKKVKIIMSDKKVYENLYHVPYIFRNYLDDFLHILKENFRDHLLSIILFGSIARGKWTDESDIDLFILFSDDFADKKSLNTTLNDVILDFEKSHELKNESNEKIYCTIQDYTLLRKELKNFRTLFYDIAMDGIILYDINKIGLNFIKKIQQRIATKNLKRIFFSDKNFYWKYKDVKFGEVFEL